MTPYLISTRCATAFGNWIVESVKLQTEITKESGKSAPASQLEHAALFATIDVRFKTAPEKTNDSSRSGSIIRAGNLHPYRPPSDHADDPFGPFSDHDVQDLLQPNNLLGADATQPNPQPSARVPQPTNQIGAQGIHQLGAASISASLPPPATTPTPVTIPPTVPFTTQQVEGSNGQIVPHQLDKDILMSPIIPNPSTLLSSPRPPDPHL